MKLSDIQFQLRIALANGDVDAIKELQHKLLLAKVLLVIGTLRRDIVEASVRIGNWLLMRSSPVIAVEAVTGLWPILRDLTLGILIRFEEELSQVTSDVRDAAIDDFLAVATPAMLRRETRLPVTDDGQLKPPAVMPPMVEDDSATLPKILLTASSALVLSGTPWQGEQFPLRDIIIKDFLSLDAVQSAVRDFDPQLSKPWQAKIQYLSRKVEDSVVSRVISQARRGATSQDIFRHGVLEPLGLRRGRGGYLPGLATEFMHESLRVRGGAEEVVTNQLDSIVGYVLHSRFLVTTDPEHASRDGQRFYKDNRAGSARPWSSRLIPPYRKNCVCFTIPIHEDPLGHEWQAEFGLRWSRGEYISIRDVGTWEQWFGAQRPGVQRKIIGNQRWLAAQQHGLGGRPSWASFTSLDGRIMSARQLAMESRAEYLLRRERVQDIMNRQSQINRDEWARRGREELPSRQFYDPVREREYRRRLEVFLRRLRGVPTS